MEGGADGMSGSLEVARTQPSLSLFLFLSLSQTPASGHTCREVLHFSSQSLSRTEDQGDKRIMLGRSAAMCAVILRSKVHGSAVNLDLTYLGIGSLPYVALKSPVSISVKVCDDCKALEVEMVHLIYQNGVLTHVCVCTACLWQCGGIDACVLPFLRLLCD